MATPQVVLDHAEMSHVFTTYLYRSNRAPVDRLIRELSPGASYDEANETVVEHLAGLGLLEEAIAHLESLEPSSAGFERVARLAFALGDDDRVIGALQKAAELDPEGPAAARLTRIRGRSR